MLDLHTACCGETIVWCDTRVARLAAYDAADKLIADVIVSSTAGRDWAATDAGAAILLALADGPLTAGELSERSGFSGGWFRTVRKGLEDAGRIVRDGGRWRLSADS